MEDATGKSRIPTSRQVIAGRGLLGWKQEQLAAASGVALSTIKLFEQGKSIPRRETLDRIKQAFELRGLVFTNGNSPTVSLQPDKATLPP